MNFVDQGEESALWEDGVHDVFVADGREETADGEAKSGIDVDGINEEDEDGDEEGNVDSGKEGKEKAEADPFELKEHRCSGVGTFVAEGWIAVGGRIGNVIGFEAEVDDFPIFDADLVVMFGIGPTKGVDKVGQVAIALFNVDGKQLGIEREAGDVPIVFEDALDLLGYPLNTTFVLDKKQAFAGLASLG